MPNLSEEHVYYHAAYLEVEISTFYSKRASYCMILVEFTLNYRFSYLFFQVCKITKRKENPRNLAGRGPFRVSLAHQLQASDLQ
jgi:hypothetical protein